MSVASWDKVVKEDPAYDYRLHIKYGFIQYAFEDANLHFDDFNVVYGTYSNVNRAEKKRGYKTKLDIEKNKLKNTFSCLFNRYNYLKHGPDKKLISNVINEFYLDFDRRASKILGESGFSYQNSQRIIIDIVSCVIQQCKNAPKKWANFGRGFKKNLLNAK